MQLFVGDCDKSLEVWYHILLMFILTEQFPRLKLVTLLCIYFMPDLAVMFSKYVYILRVELSDC
jgi:hypothetical protein